MGTIAVQSESGVRSRRVQAARRQGVPILLIALMLVSLLAIDCFLPDCAIPSFSPMAARQSSLELVQTPITALGRSQKRPLISKKGSPTTRPIVCLPICQPTWGGPSKASSKPIPGRRETISIGGTKSTPTARPIAPPTIAAGTETKGPEGS